MEKQVNIGDVVVSTAGRDQGEYFVVINVQERFATVVDGKIRKVTALKKKNVKHLKTISKGVGQDLALKILNGKSVGNKTIYRLIKAEKYKIQED